MDVWKIPSYCVSEANEDTNVRGVAYGTVQKRRALALAVVVVSAIWRERRRATFRGKTLAYILSGALRRFDVGAMAAPGKDGLESPLLASGFTSRVDRPMDETLVRGTHPPGLRPVPERMRTSRHRRL